mmetsp:Transcript_120413/g.384418  ORF Transcript_120413/g.384418 Transcript_120413/m.384418 type:complete len:116 (+) Transcript_120413:587-934(+)
MSRCRVGRTKLCKFRPRDAFGPPNVSSHPFVLDDPDCQKHRLGDRQTQYQNFLKSKSQAGVGKCGDFGYFVANIAAATLTFLRLAMGSSASAQKPAPALPCNSSRVTSSGGQLWL